jgi:hypothetical protein
VLNDRQRATNSWNLREVAISKKISREGKVSNMWRIIERSFDRQGLLLVEGK